MLVLICKNIPTEGPGTIENFLMIKEIPYTIIDLSKRDVIPNTKDFDTLLMMGGTMKARSRR